VQRGVAPALHALQQRLMALETRIPQQGTPRPWRWQAVAVVLVGVVSAVLEWSWW
jgi:hypothetical protein